MQGRGLILRASAKPDRLLFPEARNTMRTPILIGWTCTLMLTLTLAGCNTDGALDPTKMVGQLFEMPPTPIEAVNMTFDREDADRRREGINWLSGSPFGGEPDYVDLYRLFFNDPDASVRAAAARALGMHGTGEDANLLVVLLKDDNAYTRWQAARALRMIHNPVAATPLIALLGDETELDADVRQAAAEALGQYANDAVFNALVRTLEDRNYAVIAAAQNSLVTLTGHDAGDDPRDWLAWSEENPAATFQGQQVYTYMPYDEPESFRESLRFWREHQGAQPQEPTGIEVAER